MLRQVLLRNVLRRLSIHSKPPKPEANYAAVAAQPITVAARGFQTETDSELREEKRRCFEGKVTSSVSQTLLSNWTLCEGHCQSPFNDVPNWSERLASDSEAIVKSERHNNGQAPFEQMQRETVSYLSVSLHEPTIRIGATTIGFGGPVIGPKEETPLDGIPFFGVDEIQIADSKYE